jgi:hypothetical protein
VAIIIALLLQARLGRSLLPALTLLLLLLLLLL